MPQLSLDLLTAYRKKTFNILPGQRLSSVEEALSYVNQRGFVFFWPVKGYDCPSLWVAAAGDRPVPDEHDDPGHVTWGWKDGMLGLRRWYYGRCIAHRNAMVSLDLLPNFYALSPNYGDPENDYLEEYLRGVMRSETKQVYEALLREGPLNTLALRKASRLSSPENDGRFNRALDDLQMTMRVLPTGISEAGAWRYAFIYALVHRHYPALPEQARPISESAARQKVCLTYLNSVGAAEPAGISRLFRWQAEETSRAVDALAQQGLVHTGLSRADRPGTWVGLADLCF